MRTGSFAYGSPGVAAARHSLAQATSAGRKPIFCWQTALGLAALALLSGCASQTGVSSNSPMVSGFAEPQGSRFGTIAMAEASSPATFSFQKAKGKLGSAKEAILDSANLGLSGLGAGVYVTGAVLSDMENPTGGDPLGYAALAGAAGGVTAVGALLVGPAVGAEGLYRSTKSVSPMELAQREAALTNALSEMARQQPFREALLQTAAERFRGGFLSTEPGNAQPETKANAADAILEACVDELRLERAGSSEGSYFLHIKTHARLTRVVDGAICFEQSAEYRSGTDLFLDWTLQGAVQAVAETGYKALARYYVNQLLSAAPD
jgi:hypothetical protein